MKMNIRIACISLALFCLAILAETYTPNAVCTIELPASGNLLITDPGRAIDPLHAGSGVYEIDRSGTILWSYTEGLNWAHSAQRLENGNTLISNTGKDQVIIVNAAKEIVWSTDALIFSDASWLDYPDDAEYTAGGNILITDRNNHRVIEIDNSGKVVWQFGETGVAGSDATHLRQPHNADRLENGNTIICDSRNNRIIEVDSAGGIVWQYNNGLSWPRDADRLANGNTLITNSINHRVSEVTPDGRVVWERAGLRVPFEADRLENGNTLISNGRNILEVDSLGMVVWEWPSSGGWTDAGPASGLTMRKANTVSTARQGAMFFDARGRAMGPSQRASSFISNNVFAAGRYFAIAAQSAHRIQRK